MLRWNIGRRVLTGKSETPGETLSPCQFVHHKSHMDWRGIEPGPPGWDVDDKLWLQFAQPDFR